MKEVASRLRRGLGVVTPLGWFVVAVVIVALFVVWRAGWIEGAVLALMGALCLLLAVLSLLGRGTYAVDVDLVHERARVGETAFGEIRVTNDSGRRTGTSVVELPIGQGVLPLVVPALAKGETFTETFGVPATRRGVVMLGPARSVRGDALGLMSTTRNWNERVELYVHPETVRVPFDATGFQNDVEGVVTSQLSSSDVSFHAMRDYSPGDDPRHIHWPTTARTGRLSVRYYEETRRSHHLVVLDSDPDDWPEDSFELGVSVAASLALAGLRLNRKVDVVTSAERLPSAAPVPLLDALTELQKAPAEPFNDVVRRAVSRVPSLSALSIICGPKTPDDQLRTWTRAAGIDVATSVVRISPLRPAVRQTVGGDIIVDCPRLDELPRLVGSQEHV